MTFESVGGLDKHIQSLKEMIVFPLLYPEVFEKFKIAPPRGVLFYGPPGILRNYFFDIVKFVMLFAILPFFVSDVRKAGLFITLVGCTSL